MSKEDATRMSDSILWPGWREDLPYSRIETEEHAIRGVPEAEYAQWLEKAEHQWVHVQPWLAGQGYMLRPRFRPGWIPSWTRSKKALRLCEDSIPHSGVYAAKTIDAVRILDGRRVFIKHIPCSVEASQELSVTQFLSEKERRQDPRNHAVPLLDVIRAPDHCFLIFPLCRSLSQIGEDFNTLGEGLGFAHQVLEGLDYLHEQGVAHRDCAISNIVMDADRMFPHGFQPDSPGVDWRGHSLHPRTRTQVGGVRYYFIDFGESMKFESSSGVLTNVRTKASIHAPELLVSMDFLYDPFKIDVYAIGMTLKESLVQEYPGYFDMLSPLLEAMTLEDPARRPSAQEALAQFCAIKATYSRTAMHAHIRSEYFSTKFPGRHIFRDAWHWTKQIAFAIRNRSW